MYNGMIYYFIIMEMSIIGNPSGFGDRIDPEYSLLVVKDDKKELGKGSSFLSTGCK